MLGSVVSEYDSASYHSKIHESRSLSPPNKSTNKICVGVWNSPTITLTTSTGLGKHPQSSTKLHPENLKWHIQVFGKKKTKTDNILRTKDYYIDLH